MRISPPPAPAIDPAGLAHLRRVATPALWLAPAHFIEEISVRLAAAGVRDAVKRHDSAAIYDHHLRPLMSLQGLSNEVARGWDERHGGVRWAQVDATLRARPTCPRLRSYWHFAECRYTKSRGTCAEPSHFLHCPVPRLPARKGVLAQAGVSLWLFIRDICGGDFVGWLDARLAEADPGRGVPDRGVRLGMAVSEPLAAVVGLSHKVANLALVELLLAGDPDRERWVSAGGSIVVCDSLVHAFLHRSGTLHRCGAEHRYGPACYAANGCVDILRSVAEIIDVHEFDPSVPRVAAPRWIQHSIWSFCSGGGLSQCNGNRIDDHAPCWLHFCPAGTDCDRLGLYSD